MAAKHFPPQRYIARVDAITGEELGGAIDPEELLVHAHRDRHPVEIGMQFAASRLIGMTRNELLVRQGMRLMNEVGEALAGGIGFATGSPAFERRARRILGVVQREHYFRFREPTHHSEREVRERLAELRRGAAAALKRRGRNPRLQVLLTGATGFVGKEILDQAAADPRIARVIAVVRPETLRDPKTQEVVKVLGAAERGALLLRRLGIDAPRRAAVPSSSPATSRNPASACRARRSRACAGASRTSSTARRASPSTTPTTRRSAPTCSAR